MGRSWRMGGVGLWLVATMLVVFSACGDDGGGSPGGDDDGTSQGCDDPGDCPSHQCNDAFNTTGRACNAGQCATYEDICGETGAGGAGGVGGAEPCGPETCSGCCDSDGSCRNGAADDACGGDGVACVSCTAPQICANANKAVVGTEGTCAAAPLSVLWAQGYGTAGRDRIRLEAVDSNDNPIAITSLQGTSSSFEIVKYDGNDGSVMWSVPMLAEQLVVDAADNLFITFEDNDDLFYVRKLDPMGNTLWTTPLADQAPTLSIGANGNPVAFLRFDAITLDTGSYVAVDGYDLLLTELDSATGTALWVTTAGGMGDDLPGGIQHATDGAIVALAAFAANVPWAASTVSGEAVVTAMPDGTPVGAFSLPDDNYANLRLDDGGAIYLNRATNIFDDRLAKFDAAGTELWEVGIDYARDLEVSGAGVSYTVGDEGSSPPYVQSWTTEGTHRFVHRFEVDGDAVDVFASHVVRTPSGDIYFAGTYEDSPVFGDITLPPMVGNPGQYDRYLVRVTPDPSVAR